MPRLRPILSLVFLLGLFQFARANAEEQVLWVSSQARMGDFALVADERPAEIVIAPGDFKVVEIAANDLAADIERVTGQRPIVRLETRGLSGPVVLIGTLGKSPVIDDLVAQGKLDVSALRGQWETFLITTVAQPMPGVGQALVIVGSDRRGTAYGVYELAQAIGVSPWHWWADVVPEKKSALYVASGTRKFGPPSVQYRGIFINDEDWGLQPWAAKNFAPEEGGVGPKVYRKVFELLLRLKANTLWPAMHACTKPFNAFPENARLADDYAIVMGSSHAEPMLRNNVGEWTAPKEGYNYLTNRDGVLKYWEERVASNGRFENFYTLGMRGIHDSNMVGPKTDGERIAALERIFADQRAMLAKHVRPEVEQVPQMFCAYKEVLDLYRKGLKVPDDVTIVWPDDNFGYVRNFASAEEQKRSGGFGVYYHISYLGRPLAYLWLCTTPPALIWEEMSKAYDYGARKLWIVNVGDIKPAEIGTEFFLQMAWDINLWKRDNLPQFLETWAAREFGPKHAKAIADVMAAYYQLNYQRKPEHLQWWLPGQEKRWSVNSYSETDSSDWLPVSFRTDKLEGFRKTLPTERKSAAYELIYYPVLTTKAARDRYFYSERAALAVAAGRWAIAAIARTRAIKADEQLRELNKGFDGEPPISEWRDFMGAEEIQKVMADKQSRERVRTFSNVVQSEKWDNFMTLEPVDSQWKSMRISKWEAPYMPERLTAEDKSTRVFVEGREVEIGQEVTLRTVNVYSQPKFIVIESEGGESFLQVESCDDWIDARGYSWPAGGTLGRSISINWNKAPHGVAVEGRLVLANGNKKWTFRVPIFNPEHPRPEEINSWFVEIDGVISLEAEHFNAKTDRGGAGWAVIPGLGRTGDGSVAAFPTTMPAVSFDRAKADAPRLDYNIHIFKAGDFTLRVNLIPAHPLAGVALRFAVALDEGEPQLVELPFKDGSAEWAQGVLDNTRVATTTLSVPTAGAHTLRVYGLEAGVVMDKLVLFSGAAPLPGYLGPPETRVDSK